jgi:hypothetical protein
MEHVTGERNLARNTQRSYSDPLRLLLPAVAERVEKAIDRLTVEDVSADRGGGPIFDSMFIRSTDHQHLP